MKAPMVANTKSARPGRGAAANTKETASTAYNSRKPK